MSTRLTDLDMKVQPRNGLESMLLDILDILDGLLLFLFFLFILSIDFSTGFLLVILILSLSLYTKFTFNF